MKKLIWRLIKTINLEIQMSDAQIVNVSRTFKKKIIFLVDLFHHTYRRYHRHDC